MKRTGLGATVKINTVLLRQQPQNQTKLNYCDKQTNKQTNETTLKTTQTNLDTSVQRWLLRVPRNTTTMKFHFFAAAATVAVALSNLGSTMALSQDEAIAMRTSLTEELALFKQKDKHARQSARYLFRVGLFCSVFLCFVLCVSFLRIDVPVVLPSACLSTRRLSRWPVA